MLWSTTAAALCILPLALALEPAFIPVTLIGWATRNAPNSSLFSVGKQRGMFVQIQQRRSIPRSPRKSGQILSPCQRRGAPDLRAGLQLPTLIYRSQSDPNLLGVFILSRRIDRRSAISTEKLQPPTTVVRGLDVKPGRARRYLKMAALCADAHPVGGSRQSLAVGAVADRYVLRIDLGFISDLFALACAIDVHVSPPSQTLDISVRRPGSRQRHRTSAEQRGSCWN